MYEHTINVPLIISGPAPIEREQPFTRLLPPVNQLVNDQIRLCNKIVGEAKEMFERADVKAEDKQAAARKLHCMPESRCPAGGRSTTPVSASPTPRRAATPSWSAPA